MRLFIIKFKRFLCNLIGHSFAGYYFWTDEQNSQIAPTHFFCGRCKMIVDVKKGWN